MCSSDLGKTMQLAARGAKVTAVEVDPARAARIRENLARTRLSADIIESDVRDVAMTAPLVLLDAPCSATGTIRRHPDLPWIKGAADVTVSAAAAYEILESAAAMVEPGGTLVFAVCSLEREEGEEQAARVGLAPDPIRPEELPAGLPPTPEGWLRTDPGMLAEAGGLDGFFIARWRKQA